MLAVVIMLLAAVLCVRVRVSARARSSQIELQQSEKKHLFGNSRGKSIGRAKCLGGRLTAHATPLPYQQNLLTHYQTTLVEHVPRQAAR